MENGSSLVINISSLEDLEKIKVKTKYINLDLNNIDHNVLEYFLEYGDNFLYSDTIDNNKGYIYVTYEEFKNAENIINMIYANMPNDLNKLEMARYLYIALGKCLYFDINLDKNKNEICSLELLSKINNIWGSLSLGRVNDISASKIYYYLCKRVGIDINLIIDYNKKEASNKLVIDNIILYTDLFQDIPYIQAKMSTKYFTPYNDDETVDKKIKYIKYRYNNYYLDRVLKNIDYKKDNYLENILVKTKNLIDVENIKPVELSIIYKNIFNTYCPKYDIIINNLYLNNEIKNHFIMISDGDNHYSYNYKKKSFIKLNNIDIINNLKEGKIGIYLNEFIPNIKTGMNLNF